MTNYLIVALGYAREYVPCNFAGHYLQWYDPDGNENRPLAIFTPKREDAKLFPTMREAMAEWNRVRTVDPVRADGKPNKPLTALSVEIERCHDVWGRRAQKES